MNILHIYNYYMNIIFNDIIILNIMKNLYYNMNNILKFIIIFCIIYEYYTEILLYYVYVTPLII